MARQDIQGSHHNRIDRRILSCNPQLSCIQTILEHGSHEYRHKCSKSDSSTFIVRLICYIPVEMESLHSWLQFSSVQLSFLFTFSTLHLVLIRHVPGTGFWNGASALKQHFVLSKNGSKYYLKYAFLVFPVLGIFCLGTSLVLMESQTSKSSTNSILDSNKPMSIRFCDETHH